MDRTSRSRRGKVSLRNKENLPPSGAAGVSSQRKTKPKKRPLQSSVLADLPLEPNRKQVKSTTVIATTFLGLPFDVLDHLLGYLDVDSMEALGRTCSQMDLLINGPYLTSVKLPFPKRGAFMNQIKRSEVIEKKPVLKVLVPRVRDHLEFLEGSYQLDLQMSLVSLKKVREVDLLPGKIPEAPLSQTMIQDQKWWQSQEFDRIILDRLSDLGALRNISRLSIMFNDNTQGQYIEGIMPGMTNLQEFKLFVAVTWRLRKIISATRAPRVNLIIKESPGLGASERKVLQSDYIESLHVSAHCSLNICLVMKSLKEVTLKLSEGGERCCSFLRSRMDDRKIHRAGRCIVDITSVYRNCPSLLNFNGLDIGHISQSLEFNKWINRVKNIAYQDYLSSGGEKEMKKWAATRWFKIKPQIPRLQ